MCGRVAASEKSKNTEAPPPFTGGSGYPVPIDLNGTEYVRLNNGVIEAQGFTTPTIYIDGVATSTFSDTDWHHVVITTDTGVSPSDVTIGSNGSVYFDGTLDDVRLYSDVLTAGEVKRLYQLGR